MTRRRHTLRSRLLASILLVVATVSGVGYIVVRLLTPALFERRIQARGGTLAGNGRGPTSASDSALNVSSSVEDAYEQALSIAAISAAAAGAVVAMIVAWFIVRTLLRRIDEVRDATARMASGDYTTAVPEPPETELAALAASINSLGQTLATTEEKRAELLSDLAHELRNPLTTIEGYMEGIIDGVLPPTLETFNAVSEEATRLKRLTADLSLLARAQEAALQLATEPIDLADVATTAAERLRPQYEAKGVNLDIRPGEPLVVQGDYDRLTQAVTNIVGNALTHTPAGGAVSLVSGTDQHTCWVEVRDTGSGVPEELLETIFERFTRVDPQGSGIGIGLNIARTIVRAHHGDITARSDGHGTGSTFRISLPHDRST